MGDTVFVTPAIDALRRNYRNSKMIYAYAEWVESLMKYIHVDGTLMFENVYSKNIFKKISGTFKFILKARKEKFDMVLYCHRSSVFSFILLLCGIKYRLGFTGTRFLTHTAEFEKEIPEFQRYLNILSEFGFAIDDLMPALKKPLKTEVRDKIGIGQNAVLLGIYPKGGINPGTKMDIKKWDTENFYELIKLINKKYSDIIIILFEGKHASERINIPRELKAKLKTINNDIISCCDYFISVDTGSLHIAAAMGIPTLSIFGPSDPRLLAPHNFTDSEIKHITVWKKPECSPCYTPDTAIDKSNKKYWRKGEFICNTGTHICMKSVKPREVFDEFENLLVTNKNSKN